MTIENSDTLKATPQAKQYHRLKITLSIISFAVEIIFLLVLILTPISQIMADFGRAFSHLFIIQNAVYLIIFLVISELISLPIAWLRGHHLERRFGLSKQSSHAWFKDHGKAFLLNAVFTLALVEILYVFLHVGGQWWWFWTAAAFSLIFIVMVRLAPVLIFPLFFKFTPLPEDVLRLRLENLMRRAGTRISGMFVMDLSRKSNTVNAALAGIGSSRRVILADTLLKQFSDDEVEVVVAHEVGHHLHRHLLKGITMQSAGIFAFLYLIDLIGSQLATRLDFSGLADIAALPVLALTAATAGLLMSPLVNAIMRHFERQADHEAIRLSGLPEAFVSTMRRLASLNMADPSPHPVIEFLFYSHPSIKRRIEFGHRFVHADVHDGDA